MKHWKAKAYRKGKLVSTLLNCIVAHTREAAIAQAAKAYKEPYDDGSVLHYDKLTIVHQKCGQDDTCLILEATCIQR